MDCNQLQAVLELEVYFCHLHNESQISGYSPNTLLGRLIAGRGGGSRSASFIPAGVELSGSDYIRSLNRTSCALVAVKSYDLRHGTKLWDYIQARYRYRLNILELMQVFSVSRRTCERWHSQGLLFISGDYV